MMHFISADELSNGCISATEEKHLISSTSYDSLFFAEHNDTFPNMKCALFTLFFVVWNDYFDKVILVFSKMNFSFHNRCIGTLFYPGRYRPFTILFFLSQYLSQVTFTEHNICVIIFFIIYVPNINTIHNVNIWYP